MQHDQLGWKDMFNNEDMFKNESIIYFTAIAMRNSCVIMIRNYDKNKKYVIRNVPALN